MSQTVPPPALLPDTLSLIGNTPLVLLKGPSEAAGCDIYGKCEFANPGASVKDRAALWIVRDAEARGALKPGGELRCVEHGIAPDESVRRWQRRLQPFHIHLADGCHLLRNPGEIVRAAGFAETQRFEKYPLPYQKWMYFTSLRAVPTEV